VHLDGVLPDQLVLTGLRVGDRVDAHCTALGKTLLAGQIANPGDSEASRSATSSAPLVTPLADPSGPSLTQSVGASGLDREISRAEFERHTEATLDDPAKLMDDLRAVRLRGYATDLEEFAVGLRCVAAPVRDASARVIAAISLSGPSLRLDEETLHGEIATAVTAAASRLSSELGSPI
jgi:DNA-binding IclR family transcriptional regulator